MKKILSSLLVISAIVAIVAVGARALFSDTEISTGNTFTTGTIDIAVDGKNPWVSSGEYKMNDMKPSYTDYIEFKVKNVGNNPANLWKTLKNFNTYDVKCVSAETDCNIHDIDNWINYDLRVELYTSDAATEPVWWETIYMDSDNKKIGDLENKAMYLGMIPVGWTMKVTQSYHMVENTGNEYQADGMSFDIELYAEQLTNEIRLVNKYLADTDVSHHVWNGKYADFSYKVMDDKLRWELKTTNVSDGAYTLLVWDDTSNAYAWDWNTRSSAKVLAHLNDSGDMTHSGELDLGTVKNAKVWLVPGTHGTEGASAGNFPWNATGTYFETGLIDYYDSL